MAINPGNAGLSIKTNIFRNIGFRAWNAANFWKSFFRNYDESVSITLDVDYDKWERQLSIHPLFWGADIILSDNWKNVSVPISNLDKKIIGLKIEALVNWETYKGTVQQVDTDPNTITSTTPDNYKPDMNWHYLNNMTFTAPDVIADRFDSVLKLKKKRDVVNLLNNFFPTIEDIGFNQFKEVYVADQKYPELVHINTYGDWLVKAFHIMCNIIADESDIALFDEIENWLHTRSQSLIRSSILPLVKEKETQLFVTSHSYEMIRNLYSTLKDLNDTDFNIEEYIWVYRVEKRDDEHVIISYSFDELEYAMESGDEIR